MDSYADDFEERIESGDAESRSDPIHSGNLKFYVRFIVR